MTPYSPAATHTATKPSIDGSDSPSPAFFNTIIKALADECEWLRQAFGLAAASVYLPLAECGIAQGTSTGDRWEYDATADDSGWVQGSVTVNNDVYFELSLPVGSVITAIAVTLKGAWNGNNHGGNLPATQPVVALLRIADLSVANAGDVVVIGPESNDQGTCAEYEAGYQIVMSGSLGAGVTTVANARYVVRVTGESGANAAARRLVVRSVQIARSGP